MSAAWSPRVPTFSSVNTVALFHGTTTAGLELARERGMFLPLDPRQICERVALSCSLDPETLYRHQGFEFSRGRAGDPHIYTTADPYTAGRYARNGGEVLWDALNTAYWILNPPPETTDDEEWFSWRDEQTAWNDTWRDEHGYRPVVVRFTLPVNAIPVPEHSLIQDPTEWWERVNRDYPLNCLMLPAPVPYTFVDGTLTVEEVGADRASDRISV